MLTGQFIREFCKRDEVVIATKVFYPVQMQADARPPLNSHGLSR